MYKGREGCGKARPVWRMGWFDAGDSGAQERGVGEGHSLQDLSDISERSLDLQATAVQGPNMITFLLERSC